MNILEMFRNVKRIYLESLTVLHVMHQSQWDLRVDKFCERSCKHLAKSQLNYCLKAPQNTLRSLRELE